MAQTLAATLGGRTRLWRSWAWTLAVTALVTVLAGMAALQTGAASGVALGFTLAALVALMLPYLAFAMTSFARDVAFWMRYNVGAVAQIYVGFLAVYLVYAAGTQSFAWLALAKIAAFTGAPILLVTSARRKRPGFAWQDWVAVAAIWLPFDFGLLDSVWTWPAGHGAYVLNTIMAVDLAVCLFVCARGLTDVGFRFRLGRRDLKLVGGALALFLVIALPFGIGSGFIAVHPQVTLSRVFVMPLGVLFFIAVPEELLFRGLIQNMLEKRLGRFVPALVVTALVFGASHLNNGPHPDWRYFALASVAGVFYGWVYAKSRSIVVPALLHAAVDTIWMLFFQL